MLHIQPLCQQDLAALLKIETQVYDFPWSYQMFASALAANNKLVGAFCGGKLIAYILYLQVLDEAQLLNIAVSSSYRRRGVAQELLQHMLLCCKINNIAQVFLEVRSSNLAAISLYSKFGFSQIATRKNYYKTTDKLRENALIMRCQLGKNG